jgi:hypothetical protein
MKGTRVVVGPDHDAIDQDRIMILSFCWNMIFSENRFPLFPIML